MTPHHHCNHRRHRRHRHHQCPHHHPHHQPGGSSPAPPPATRPPHGYSSTCRRRRRRLRREEFLNLRPANRGSMGKESWGRRGSRAGGEGKGLQGGRARRDWRSAQKTNRAGRLFSRNSPVLGPTGRMRARPAGPGSAARARRIGAGELRRFARRRLQQGRAFAAGGAQARTGPRPHRTASCLESQGRGRRTDTPPHPHPTHPIPPHPTPPAPATSGGHGAEARSEAALLVWRTAHEKRERGRGKKVCDIP